MPRQLFLMLCCSLVGFAGCKPKEASLVTRETFAELRVVKGELSIAESGKRARRPYPRERIGAGAQLSLAANSLAIIRDDAGATWLLAGPAQATVIKHSLELVRGKVFVDTQGGPSVSLRSIQGEVEIAEGRSSISVDERGAFEAYALRGSLRHGAIRATAGELLRLGHGLAPTTEKIASWTDWTSGLATADPEAQPAPFGIGTVGARAAGQLGKPRFALGIQRLEVKVTIDHDFAETEVDETFINPSSSEVEGLFSFRVPQNAVLHRFGVDRDGFLVWGQPQEKRSAAAQYASNVFAGSSEDPALLEWIQRGVYQARLYPIAAGASRRVVTRYGEWLARHGERGERRLYVYPMAANGAEGTLPRIEEMTIRIDWSKAQAKTVRAPMGSVVRGRSLVIKGFDVVPKADFAVELFDSGRAEMLVYRAHHALGKGDAPVGAEATFAQQTSEQEPDYLLLPLQAPKLDQLEPGLDLAIVVDTSGATEPSAAAVSRSLVEALLTALGPTDRAALFTGDTALRPVAAESGQLSTLDEPRRKRWLAELANAPFGGATDLGTMLAEAAGRLEAKRLGAVIYIGDGRPSVGEMLPKPLRERLARLPPTARIFAVGVGTQVNSPLLESLVRGAPLETVQNGYEAAQAALRLLEAANLPSWQNVKVELDGVHRLLPTPIPVVAAGEPALLVGRIDGTTIGDQLRITGPDGMHSVPIRVVTINDDGDLRRRWGDGRLSELLEQNTGRLAVVDLARRYGLVTPYTSLYVATRREAEAALASAESNVSPEQLEQDRADRLTRWRPWARASFTMRSADAPRAATAEQSLSAEKEGGTGTRAKGEEGSSGNQIPHAAAAGEHRLAKAKSVAPAAPSEVREYGMLSVTRSAREVVAAKPGGPAADSSDSREPTGARKNARYAANPSAAEALGGPTSNAEEPAEVATESPGLQRAAAVRPARGAFGAGHGRLGGSHATTSSNLKVQLETPNVDYAKPPSVKAQDPAATPTTQSMAPTLSPIAQLSHQLLPCSAASDLPLSERRKLWREALSGKTTSSGVREVYATAIRDCEAPGWYERQLLLYGMIDQLSAVAERVRLFQSFANNPTVAALIYRAILVRIQDAAGLREFHEALGIKQAAPELIARLLRRANSPEERVKFLRELTAAWPRDLELTLQLLEAYEDASDGAAARGLARQLRRRADATAQVRTLVGEFFWRCSEHGSETGKSRDLEEARRAFGEIVEFAPEDPAARRRLGDLLRAHGWYEEALRQYETLRLLLPDDPSVHLLIAAAAQGVGKTEEALRWSEKAASIAAPDGQSELEIAAIATSAAFMAWAREDAIAAGHLVDAERLLLRAQKLAPGAAISEGQVRFILTWEHPELHPTLYGVTRDGLVLGRQAATLGVAVQWTAAAEPRVELHLDPEDAARVARLGAEAVLTVIVADGTSEQKVTHARLRFGDVRHPKPILRYAYANGVLHEEAL